MDSEDRFQPEPAPTDSPEKTLRPHSGRAPPRLGIVHLLVWTACVALYLGLTRMMTEMIVAHTADYSPAPATLRGTLAGTFNGIGSGTALGGLLLFASRPSRGFRFPSHPGEYLWVLLGLGVAIRLVGMSLTTVWYILAGGGTALTTWVSWPFLLLSLVLHVAIWIWVLVRVKKRRWRVYFAILIASNVLYFAPVALLARLAPALVPALGSIVHIVLRLAVDTVLVVVLLKDLADAERYPWTHWLGAVTRLWFTAVSVGAILLFYR